MTSSFSAVIHGFSHKTTHVLRVYNVLSIQRWSEVKPVENDDAIYEQPHTTWSIRKSSSSNYWNKLSSRGTRKEREGSALAAAHPQLKGSSERTISPNMKAIYHLDFVNKCFKGGSIGTILEGGVVIPKNSNILLLCNWSIVAIAL